MDGGVTGAGVTAFTGIAGGGGRKAAGTALGVIRAAWAASMAWAILSEPVTVWQLGGGLLILAGIYAARPKPEKERFIS